MGSDGEPLNRGERAQVGARSILKKYHFLFPWVVAAGTPAHDQGQSFHGSSV